MAQLTREDWIEAGFGALSTGDIDGVRIERLAKDLGVTKGSFYWHFENRRALLDAMIEEWERLGTSRIIEVVDATSGDPIERLRALVGLTTTNHLRDKLEARVRVWAGIDPAACEMISRIDERRIAYVVDLLVEAGVAKVRARLRAEALYRMMIGEFVWRTTGGPPANEQLRDEIIAMVSGSPTSTLD